MNVVASPRIQDIVEEIDKLIVEMAALRSRVSALGSREKTLQGSVRDTEFFGMWSDREDMRGLSSRDWLEGLRGQQWTRP